MFFSKWRMWVRILIILTEHSLKSKVKVNITVRFITTKNIIPMAFYFLKLSMLCAKIAISNLFKTYELNLLFATCGKTCFGFMIQKKRKIDLKFIASLDALQKLIWKFGNKFLGNHFQPKMILKCSRVCKLGVHLRSQRWYITLLTWNGFNSLILLKLYITFLQCDNFPFKDVLTFWWCQFRWKKMMCLKKKIFATIFFQVFAILSN